MESVPDEIVQHILSQMQNARDIASCSCVSKQWVDSVSYIPSLYFPRNAFELVSPSRADATMTRMVSSAIRLEELVVYCPFLASSLASWLSLRSRTLRVLELRMDSASEDKPDSSLVDCVGLAKGLEELKLWGLTMTKSPDWGVFVRLRNLEIDRATVTGDALKAALGACPNLTDLRMISCNGAESVVVEMERLQNCSLDFHVTGYCSLSICCPMLRVLEVQGFDMIRVSGNHHLACLSIQKNSGRVHKVEIGRLAELEYLNLGGFQWNWSVIDLLLRSASEVNHLVMKIEFTGDHDTLESFPEIDLVDFFNGHPKLKRFEIHGAMFAALCQRNSLKNLHRRFRIPCLEHVSITVRSPLNPKQKLNTLNLLVNCSEKLRKMVIRVVDKNFPDGGGGLFEELKRFQFMNNRIVHVS